MEDSALKYISQKEEIPENTLREDIKAGRSVIIRHKVRRPAAFCAVGRGLRTKVNVNIGTSPGFVNIKEEEDKIRISEEFGADTLMDLSTGGDIDSIRKDILGRTGLPVGTVPVYQAAVEDKMGAKGLLGVIRRHAEDGVDFMTVHCGITRKGLGVLENNPRVMGVVSRGGALISGWMKKNNAENPIYRHFTEVVDIAREYDVVLSLGDGMRPGCIADATDPVQVYELEILSELAQMALEGGAQVIIEGPGHLPIGHIERNIRMQKEKCSGAPFYVLGPLVTDTAPGYDHITAAIGGALAAGFGADFLCSVTPAEHLRLPDANDVKEGLIASRIAAHSGDIAKGIKGADERDMSISCARAKRDWKMQIKLAMDPVKAGGYRNSRMPEQDDVCTMCGRFCSLKLMKEGYAAFQKEGREVHL